MNLLYTLAGVAPVVAMTAPANGATVTGNNVVVSATATAGTGASIKQVQFEVDNSPQAQVPVVNGTTYSITLDATKLSNGAHTLAAVATDTANTSSTSAGIGITVNNNPAVAITTPANGATISGRTWGYRRRRRR